MTSFLHFQNAPTGTQVPGGACGTAGVAGRLKLVAPRGSESTPVPTLFPDFGPFDGGNGRADQASDAGQGRGAFATLGKSRAVCRRAGRTGPTPEGRGVLSGAGPDTFSRHE
jgi:hypothetical protein